MHRSRFRFYPKLQSLDHHPKAWNFPAYLDASIPWVRTLKDLYASPLTFPASMSPEAGLFLHALVRNTRPRTLIEIGTFLGVSTIWMASALEAAANDPPHAPTSPGQLHGLIHCFDDFTPIPPGPWRDEKMPDRPRDQIVMEHLARAALAHRAKLHPGNSSQTIKAHAAELRAPAPTNAATPAPHTAGIDFALIDGDHATPGALEDLWAVEPLLNTGGYIVLHDIYPEQCGDHQGPRHIIDHILSVAHGLYELCEVYTAPLNYGMAVLRRVG
jgi:predicted O-methyltransferase YrrM